MTLLLVLAILMTASWAMAAPDLQLGVAPLTRKVFRSNKVEPLLPGAALELWGAGNEKISLQLVITAGYEPLENASVTLAGDLIGPQGVSLRGDQVALWKVAYVHAAKLEKYYPDPLPPLQGDFDVSAGQNQSIWVKVSIPEHCKPGLYEGALVVNAKGIAPMQVPLQVHVWPFTLPVTPHLRTAFGLKYDKVIRAHEVEEDSPEAQALKRRYYEMLVDHRVSPYHLPVPIHSPEALPYLRNPRLTSFVAGEVNRSLLPSQVDIDFLTHHGLLHKALFYPVDEPRDQERYDTLVKLGNELHQSNPAAKIVTPFFHKRRDFADGTAVDLLAGTTSVWCPETGTYRKDKQLRDQLHQRRASGEEIWLYVCCSPGGSYCNFSFINQESIRYRLLFWQVRQHRADGFLYYNTIVNWGHDPWEAMGGWGPSHDMAYGDGYLLYPGAKVGIAGPVSSQRLECILAGMQDIEYFELLRRTEGEQAVQEVIAQMVTDWTTYSLDDGKLEQLRRQMGTRLAGPGYPGGVDWFRLGHRRPVCSADLEVCRRLLERPERNIIHQE